MNRDLRPRNAKGGSWWQAPEYVVAAALIVGGALLTSSSAGVGWALVLFAIALVIAKNDPSKGRTATAAKRHAIVVRRGR